MWCGQVLSGVPCGEHLYGNHLPLLYPLFFVFLLFFSCLLFISLLFPVNFSYLNSGYLLFVCLTGGTGRRGVACGFHFSESAKLGNSTPTPQQLLIRNPSHVRTSSAIACVCKWPKVDD